MKSTTKKKSVRPVAQLPKEKTARPMSPIQAQKESDAVWALYQAEYDKTGKNTLYTEEIRDEALALIAELHIAWVKARGKT
jgi:hypothetical protein